MKRSIVFLMTISLMLVMSCSQEKVDEYAMVNFVIGEVLCNKVPVQIGQILKEKDVIVTSADSSCDIKIGGSIIRVKERSDLVLSSLLKKGDTENTVLGIGTGKMLCKPQKLLKDSSFVVKTPTAVAGVRGTQFTVEADMAKTTRIKVFDGKVKIAKRVKQFETSTKKVLEVAPVISREQKVIITEKEVKAAEKKVESVLKKYPEAARDESVIAAAIEKTNKEITVSEEDIQKFTAEDFVKEGEEIISIKEKPREVVVKIKKVIKQEKQMPKPDGRLLITRYEVYFIKNGKVKWEGKVTGKPIRKDGRVYIASGEYVFCASVDGPVLWRKNIINDGSIQIKKGAVVVSTKGSEHRLDPDTGQKL